MHIKRIELHRFKQFSSSDIKLKDGLSLLVGGNNSGKSSILQALATWQFCITLLEIEKGRKAWVQASGLQGIGMGIVDFTPMNVPSLSHLWTNLKTQRQSEPDGYTLKIKVYWDNSQNQERHLEVGLSLANDRIFIKTTATNLSLDEVETNGNPIPNSTPSIAYLPPFAGVTDREMRLTPAMRNRLLGQGLSGGVIRNVLFELHETNRLKRQTLREGRTKIKNSDLASLRNEDPWEVLQKTMQDIFGTELKIIPFNERYHSYLKVECSKGKVESNGVFKRFPNFNARDLMVEGSGFLQWLSVYALALSPEIDIVLLDEPDAHLHPLLQQQLVSQLRNIAAANGKQVLLATHSPELIRGYESEQILSVIDRRAKYLGEDDEKVKILAGIGAIHTPRIHKLAQHKKLLILEAESDERFLKLFFERAKLAWPEDLVTWYWTGNVSERRQLHSQLKKEIPELITVSIRDRDEEADGTVAEDLRDKSLTNKDPSFRAFKWKRRHIENYLLCTTAIARATEATAEEITLFFKEHGHALPEDTTPHDVAPPVREAYGKEILTEGPKSLKARYGITRESILKAMEPTEVPSDIYLFWTHLYSMH